MVVFRQLRQLMTSGYVFARESAAQLVLIVLSILCEALSLSLLVPVLKMIESGQSLADLAKGSGFWKTIAEVFTVLGIPQTLLGLLGTVFAAVCLRQAIRYQMVMSISRLKQRVEMRLSLDLYGAMLRVTPEILQAIGTGRFAFIVNNISNGAAAILRTHFAYVNSVLICVAYVAMSIPVAPVPALVGIAIALIVARLMKRFGLHSRRLAQRGLETRQALQNHLAERYRNWRIVKLANTEATEISQLNGWARRLFNLDLTNSRISALSDLAVVPLMTGLTLSILYLSVEVFHIQVSQIAFLVMMLIRLEPIVRGFSQQRQSLERFGVQLDEAFRLLDEYTTARERESGNAEFQGCAQAVEFRDVRYTYPGSSVPAVAGMSFRIPAHAVTALVGPSGSGKSTLVDLLTRLLKPEQGSILVDGQDISSYQLASLRKGMAYVSQRPVLFDMTIAENISYGIENVNEAELVEAARLAGALGFISAMPEGFASKAGEGGVKLSGGQQQRLGLARAFLSGAPLLILDEPTSAVDFESEELIKQAIDTIVRERGTTVIIIAHRASTISNASHVVVIDKGEIVLEGTPANLMAETNWYSRMVVSESADMESKTALRP